MDLLLLCLEFKECSCLGGVNCNPLNTRETEVLHVENNIIYFDIINRVYFSQCHVCGLLIDNAIQIILPVSLKGMVKCINVCIHYRASNHLSTICFLKRYKLF